MNTGYQPPVSPTPYEQLMASKKKATRGRPPLSDWQREQRKKAGNLANRRALAVMRERHKEEWNALVRAERVALVALIDAEYAANPENPTDLWDLTDRKKETTD